MNTAISVEQGIRNIAKTSLLVMFALVPGGAPGAAPDPHRPPGQAVVEEARSLVAGMITNARGPYSRLRWFCNDGTVQPPTPYACVPHGGGRQHAEYSPERQRLAELGYRVGTIFAAMTWQEFWDGENHNQRLKELALERYMTEVADGWVLRRAQDYRGRVQVEDEEAAGRRLLLRLLDDPDWIRSNYLLARETVRVVPHSGGGDLTREIRRSSQDIAEAEPAFDKLRIEIHSTPSAETAARVRRWIGEHRKARSPDALLKKAETLADDLDELYGARGRARRLKEAALELGTIGPLQPVAHELLRSESRQHIDRIRSLAGVLVGLRQSLADSLAPEARLLLLDLLGDIEAELRLSAEDVLNEPSFDRRSLLQLTRHFVTASYGSGFLSPGELKYTLAQIDGVLRSDLHDVEDYLELSRALNRAVSWPYATVRFVFAQPLARYSALQAAAERFPDDLLRGSPVMLQARASRLVAHDAQLAGGIRRRLSGKPTPALMALNPGVARGKLRILTESDLNDGVQPDRSEIVLLPQTVAELTPVAGILTGGEGNLLSHLQLLARNLGIPNVSVSAALFVDLLPLEGKEIVLAVDGKGSIVIEAVSDLGEETLARLHTNRPAFEARSLDVPEPDLSRREPIRLSDLNGGLSGRVVGPKAANVGQLNRHFPGKVAPALALPFGAFDAHVNGNGIGLRQRLSAIFEARESGNISEAELIAELGRLRGQIAGTSLSPDARRIILARMKEEFGESEALGLFIRSDTNVEDLPGFSGAGLSETLFNVVGTERQLAGIPLVWSSILSPRSIAWRANLMKNPERIYASVLLMKSVPADKSGVLVTADLIAHGDGLTVSTAWGVGGAVSGESAETLVLMSDGSERLISESKAPFHRKLAAKGGIEWAAATAGPVLDAREKGKLRKLALDVGKKYRPIAGPDGRPMPWDIEFGFVDGDLTLFQIRPLVEKTGNKAAAIIRLISGEIPEAPAASIDLHDRAILPGELRP